MQILHAMDKNCFLRNHDHHGMYHFLNNSATNGGDDLYGASSQECFINHHGYGTSESSVPSDPLQACVCETAAVINKSQCISSPEYGSLSLKVHPGERFTVPIFLV